MSQGEHGSRWRNGHADRTCPRNHACPSASRTPRGGWREPLHLGLWVTGGRARSLSSGFRHLEPHQSELVPRDSALPPLRLSPTPRSHGTAIFYNLPPTPPQKVAGASHKPSSDRKSQLLAGSSEAWVGLQSCPHSGPETVYQRPTLGETVSMVPAMRLQWEASSRAQPAEGDQGGLGRAQNSDPMQYPSQFQCSV